MNQRAGGQSEDKTDRKERPVTGMSVVRITLVLTALSLFPGSPAAGAGYPPGQPGVEHTRPADTAGSNRLFFSQAAGKPAGLRPVLLPAAGDLDGSGRSDSLDLYLLRLCLAGGILPGTPPFTSPAGAGDVDGDGVMVEADRKLLAAWLTEAGSDGVTAGIDFQELDAAFALAGQFDNLKSLVVARDGRVIKEQYQGTGGADQPHDVRSVTKSVTALLIGIAIDKGYLRSTGQTLGEFFDPAEYGLSSTKAAIRIHDLLTMSSGFQWEELQAVSGYNNWITSPDQVRYVLQRPLIARPGTYFTYNSGALHLLSVILTLATGMYLDDFARVHLITPLGIEGRDWQVDRQGYNNGSAGLNLTPREMVKIGNLILSHGIQEGESIVSRDYLDQLTATRIDTHDSMDYGPGYGFGWWTGHHPSGDYVFATGWGGQFIVVVPDLRLVVVATNEWRNVATPVANNQWFRTIDLIMTRIVPAVQAGQ